MKIQHNVFQMNPYAPPKLPRQLTKDEKHQLIMNRPDIGILGFLWAKYPKTSMISACILAITIGITTVEIALRIP